MYDVITIIAIIAFVLLFLYIAYLLRYEIKALDLRRYIETLVEAAEQLLKAVDFDGSERKAFVCAALEKAGYIITDHIDTLIEAAVYRLNQEQR